MTIHDMPITAQLILLAELYTMTDDEAPTTETAGTIGDVLLDTSSGRTYELTAIQAGPPRVYVWEEQPTDDKMVAAIERAATDLSRIMNAPVEPDLYDNYIAEMACYILGLGPYEGRGMESESVGQRSRSYDRRIMGYPESIVGALPRRVGVK